jgi:hypothetical protein
MLPTPAHDGVRLLLPAFFFLAAFAGWGTVALALDLQRLLRLPTRATAPVLAALVLVPAAIELARIHPYELSYYNALIGGPRGAWQRGFELTYWFDAFNARALAELNAKLPKGVEVDFPNDLTSSDMTFQELQSLGELRGDIFPGGEVKKTGRRYEQLPYVWLQTQDSKATAFSRLLFAMRPWWALEPPHLDGLRVATVADPVAVSRAWALEALLDAPDRSIPEPPRIHRLMLNGAVIDWARTDPRGFLSAARSIAATRGAGTDRAAQRLLNLILDDPNLRTVETRQFYFNRLLAARPEALVEAAQILLTRPDAVSRVMTRYGYTDPATIGGFLDQDLPADSTPATTAASPSR